MAQAEWAAEIADTAPAGPLLELCSGVGQIGLALARLCADRGRPRDLVLVDAESHACSLARRNVDHAGLGSAVEVRESTLQQALRPDEMFAVIVADPPWVPTVEAARYPADPLWAIDGGADGMVLARDCVAVISRHLLPGGSAVLQLGTVGQIEGLANDLREPLELVEQRDVEDANGALAKLVHRGRGLEVLCANRP